MSALFLPTTGAFAETKAGTSIDNTAQLHLTSVGGAQVVASNTVSVIVAERLDVTLTQSSGGSIAVVPGGTAVPVVLTNTGNGDEAFLLAAVLPDTSASVRLIAIDRNGDGRFDPAVDTVLTDSTTPMLAPGEALTLLVVLDPAADPVTATSLTVTARAVTGTGPKGTSFPGKGDGGGDAVTGETGAGARLVLPFGGTAGAPTLVKSQVVLAPDGSTSAVRDAVVTYTLEAHFTAATPGVRITDPVPAGTTYVAGSLRLDDAVLTDAADSDAGSVGGGQVAVALGDIAGAAVRTVRFQVKIQ